MFIRPSFANTETVYNRSVDNFLSNDIGDVNNNNTFDYFDKTQDNLSIDKKWNFKKKDDLIT